ncbi:MAG: asparagine synthase (glutamine-hydrolyzing) [Candidatus Nitrosothermus koennekii]|nr:MAG: asparagine synthase (glutamine-hydrolyzing) [Candidatus Nitrosothermus koennekii]
MCGIAGILSKSEEDMTSSIKKMLISMQTRGPDGIGLAISNKLLYMNWDAIKDVRVEHNDVMAHARLAIVGGLKGSQPFTDCNNRIIVEHNGEIYNYKELRRELGEHKFRTNTDSEVIIHLLEEHYKGDLYQALKIVLKKLDGIFAIVAKDEKYTALVRDSLGIRQLYYGNNEEMLAFASEKKALWAIEIKNVKRVLPGHIILIDNERKEIVKDEKVLEPIRYHERIYDMDNAINAYYNALIKSMKKRTQDLDRIGVIFSGGIDSVIIAKLASEMVGDVRCYCAGLIGSHDIDYSRKIAKALGLRLEVNELTKEDIEELLPDIIETIEETNVGQVEVAIPVYAAIQLASNDGLRVVLSGQGADELFGGYPWYSKIVESKGYEQFHGYLKNDLLLLYKETLEREDKIAMAHSVEMRVPYLDLEVVSVAMSIDPRLKVFKDDRYGKRVHRELAKRLGIQDNIAYRNKEAAQHGSGIHDVIKEIARKKYKKHIANINRIDREPIGSSQRYGYKFDDEDEWIIDDDLQAYIDYLVLKHGLVNRYEFK